MTKMLVLLRVECGAVLFCADICAKLVAEAQACMWKIHFFLEESADHFWVHFMDLDQSQSPNSSL